MKKYTCPKCGSSRTVGDLVVAGDVGCGCRVSGYSIEYTDEDRVRKYPDQVLRNKDTSMKLPEKLRVPILWGHTRDNVKVVYENIPEVRAAETINQILDYLAKGEKQVSGPTLGVSSNYGPVTTVPSLPHEPVVSNTPLFKVADIRIIGGSIQNYKKEKHY